MHALVVRHSLIIAHSNKLILKSTLGVIIISRHDFITVCREDAEAAVIEAKLAHPPSLAFWYCSDIDFKSLQWESRDS